MLREIRPRHLHPAPADRDQRALAYPLAMTAIAGVIFPKQAQGSLIEKDGKVVGSALIGQEFKDDKYFHGRPSATTAPDPADSTKDGAGALQRRQFRRLQPRPDQQGVLNDRVKDDVEKLKAENPSAAVPADLVTTSASGLDPDISPEGALFQVPRHRQGAETCRKIASGSWSPRNTRGRLAGLLGEPRVNVLELNLALDDAASK